MLLEALETARDLGRLNEVATVFVRHGLGDLVHRWGLAGLLRRAGRAVHIQAVERLEPVPLPVRLRRALEDLGPTYVKLGQLLAGRADLLPIEFAEELARLQEEARELPWDDLRPQLVEDLGRPPEEVFAEISTEPLASASIAQVHRARLTDGTEVVLKVRRPGIAEMVEADLRLFQRLAELAEHEMPELRTWRLRGLARHFARTIQAELDLRIEARYCERIAANLRDLGGVVVPRVHWTWTGRRLLVQDFVEGQSAAEWIRAGRPPGPDGHAIAGLGADVVLKMVFLDGLYHADPHPGNVLLLPGDRIGLLDFGMIGRLSEERRREFLRLMAAIVERKEDEMVDLLLGWSSDGEVDIELLGHDCLAFIDRYHGLTLAELDATVLLRDVAALVRENHLSLPVDVAALLKAFVTLDGLGRALDPDFDMAGHVEPFAREAIRRQTSPLALLRRNLRGLEFLLRDLPRDVSRIVTSARRGRLRLEFDLRRLDAFGHQLDRSANRITVGLVTSALIVGTAISLTVSGGPEVLGLPVFATFGFLCSVVVGLCLLWSIWRAGKR